LAFSPHQKKNTGIRTLIILLEYHRLNTIPSLVLIECISKCIKIKQIRTLDEIAFPNLQSELFVFLINDKEILHLLPV